jgi:hypothetical protein
VIAPFDIFHVESDRLWKWKATAETLDVARLRIKILMAGDAGDYVICSQQTGHKMVIKWDGSVDGATG